LPLVAAMLCGLVACTPGPVSQQAPGVDAEERQWCEQVMAALPQTVLDQQRRASEPADLTAAWGEPPISLRCGVDKPPRLGPGSECFEVNRAGWFAEEGNGGMVFTTIGRPVYVEVGVPTRYAPEANALVDLAAAVALLPVEQPCV